MALSLNTAPVAKAVATPAFAAVIAAAQNGAQRVISEISTQANTYVTLAAAKAKLQLERDNLLAWMKSMQPRWDASGIEYNAALEKLEGLRESMIEKVRGLKQTVTASGIEITYEDPQRSVFDAELLLRLHPTAASIPGLVKRELDGAIFDSAVAAGLIPATIATQVKTSEPVTSAGRVTFKPPKG